MQPDHSPFLLLCQECSDRDKGLLPPRFLYFCVDLHKIQNIEFIHPQVFAKEVIEKVQELDQEKMKTEKAFHDFLPLTIVRDIKLKKVL